MEEKKKKRGRPRKKSYSYSKTRNKAPVTRSSREYDFLQYIRIVFKWAISYSKLSRGEVEVLLYLYPKGTFTKTDFSLFQKTSTIYQTKILEKLTNEGWLHLWRPKKGKQTALYALTTKAKLMCARMHSFLTGDIEIPVGERSNPLIKKEKRIDGYYMDIIYKMNKEREQRLKEKETEE